MHTNRLPQLYQSSSPDNSQSLLLMSRSPTADPQPSSFYLGNRLISLDNSNNWPAYRVDNRRLIINPVNDDEIEVSDDLKTSNGLFDIQDILLQQDNPESSSSVDKRMATNSHNDQESQHNHHHQHNGHNQDPITPSAHHFDLCSVSYDVRDLGHGYYPRYIESANCKHRMPPTLQHRIKCVPIHYVVKVLTRKDSHPTDETTTQRASNLPEQISQEYHFVPVNVNVGCHCFVV